MTDPAIVYSEGDEKAILGCLIEDRETLKIYLDSIRESDFFVPAHKRLFRDLCYFHDLGEIATVEKLAGVKRKSSALSLSASARLFGRTPQITTWP